MVCKIGRHEVYCMWRGMQCKPMFELDVDQIEWTHLMVTREYRLSNEWRTVNIGCSGNESTKY